VIEPLPSLTRNAATNTRSTSRGDLVKRICLASLVIAAFAASPAAAFHHTDLPATACHAPAAGSPSNDNGMAKEALLAHSPNTLPLPPVGTPGEGQGQGGEHCANAPID
jgi:hypothetical protein